MAEKVKPVKKAATKKVVKKTIKKEAKAVKKTIKKAVPKKPAAPTTPKTPAKQPEATKTVAAKPVAQKKVTKKEVAKEPATTKPKPVPKKKATGSVVLNQTKLQELIHVDNLEEFFYLIHIVDDKEIEKFIEYFKENKKDEKTKIAVLINQSETGRDLVEKLKGAMIEHVQDEYDDLKSRISTVRKEGIDLYIEGVKMLAIPLKMKMYGATLEKKDYYKIKQMIQVISDAVKLHEDELEKKKLAKEQEEARRVEEAKAAKAAKEAAKKQPKPVDKTLAETTPAAKPAATTTTAKTPAKQPVPEAKPAAAKAKPAATKPAVAKKTPPTTTKSAKPLPKQAHHTEKKTIVDEVKK